MQKTSPLLLLLLLVGKRVDVSVVGILMPGGSAHETGVHWLVLRGADVPERSCKEAEIFGDGEVCDTCRSRSKMSDGLFFELRRCCCWNQFCAWTLFFHNP